LGQGLVVVLQHDVDLYLQGQAERIVAAWLAAALLEVRAGKRHDRAARDRLDGSRRSPVAVEQASSRNQKSAMAEMVSMGYGRCCLCY
jgi:hypothetical protein